MPVKARNKGAGPPSEGKGKGKGKAPAPVAPAASISLASASRPASTPASTPLPNAIPIASSYSSPILTPSVLPNYIQAIAVGNSRLFSARNTVLKKWRLLGNADLERDFDTFFYFLPQKTDAAGGQQQQGQLFRPAAVNFVARLPALANEVAWPRARRLLRRALRERIAASKDPAQAALNGWKPVDIDLAMTLAAEEDTDEEEEDEEDEDAEDAEAREESEELGEQADGREYSDEGDDNGDAYKNDNDDVGGQDGSAEEMQDEGEDEDRDEEQTQPQVIMETPGSAHSSSQTLLKRYGFAMPKPAVPIPSPPSTSPLFLRNDGYLSEPSGPASGAKGISRKQQLKEDAKEEVGGNGDGDSAVAEQITREVNDDRLRSGRISTRANSVRESPQPTGIIPAAAASRRLSKIAIEIKKKPAMILKQAERQEAEAINTPPARPASTASRVVNSREGKGSEAEDTIKVNSGQKRKKPSSTGGEATADEEEEEGSDLGRHVSKRGRQQWRWSLPTTPEPLKHTGRREDDTEESPSKRKGSGEDISMSFPPLHTLAAVTTSAVTGDKKKALLSAAHHALPLITSTADITSPAQDDDHNHDHDNKNRSEVLGAKEWLSDRHILTILQTLALLSPSTIQVIDPLLVPLPDQAPEMTTEEAVSKLSRQLRHTSPGLFGAAGRTTRMVMVPMHLGSVHRHWVLGIIRIGPPASTPSRQQQQQHQTTTTTSGSREKDTMQGTIYNSLPTSSFSSSSSPAAAGLDSARQRLSLVMRVLLSGQEGTTTEEAAAMVDSYHDADDIRIARDVSTQPNGFDCGVAVVAAAIAYVVGEPWPVTGEITMWRGVVALMMVMIARADTEEEDKEMVMPVLDIARYHAVLGDIIENPTRINIARLEHKAARAKPQMVTAASAEHLSGTSGSGSGDSTIRNTSAWLEYRNMMKQALDSRNQEVEKQLRAKLETVARAREALVGIAQALRIVLTMPLFGSTTVQISPSPRGSRDDAIEQQQKHEREVAEESMDLDHPPAAAATRTTNNDNDNAGAVVRAVPSTYRTQQEGEAIAADIARLARARAELRAITTDFPADPTLPPLAAAIRAIEASLGLAQTATARAAQAGGGSFGTRWLRLCALSEEMVEEVSWLGWSIRSMRRLLCFQPNFTRSVYVFQGGDQKLR